MSRLLLGMVALSLALSSCGHHFQERIPPLRSGITGNVVAGPQCPVQVVGSPCPDRPVAAYVTASDGSGRGSNIRTDAEGRFTLPLPSGTYTVTAREITDNPRLAKPQTVVVRADTYTTITIVIDTGIR